VAVVAAVVVSAASGSGRKSIKVAIITKRARPVFAEVQLFGFSYSAG